MTRKLTFAAACREAGISRQCGYKWWRRFRRKGAAGLKERSHRSRRAESLQRRWCARVLALRRRHRTWGAPKIRGYLKRRHARAALPGVSTISRWLAEAGLVRPRVRWTRPGPRVPAAARAPARQPNDVWTVDFKGSFRTHDARRVYALTVRDATTHYVLAVRHAPKPDDVTVRTIFIRLFRRYGLPRALQMDNGTPFGAVGPLGLSRLSVWWLRLGIELRFSRPACPQDNPAHEQMHGVLKAETTRPPSANPQAQQRRFDRWRTIYNHVRPHAALANASPADHYRPSPRRYPATLPDWSYPPNTATLCPGTNGRAWWQQRQRLIGRAFAGERLGLQITPTCTQVRLGPFLIGTLHAEDMAGLRPARWTRP
ncbi:MAG TPA: DDE-type integrase/transposase/recombinase [Opitutus sp.]|nr:DDE-type integrase/transposase/recombinase [Opitutus sp.]